MTRRLHTGAEVREMFKRAGHDYADILEATDDVDPTAETGDDCLYDAAAIAAIRAGLEEDPS